MLAYTWKWYTIVIPCALMVYLIYTSSALGLLGVYTRKTTCAHGIVIKYVPDIVDVIVIDLVLFGIATSMFDDVTVKSIQITYYTCSVEN